MLSPEKLFRLLTQHGITFFTGVPDSLLKDFCSYVSMNVEPNNHVIASNEGNAVGLAVGFHLATGKFGLVYLQNSGLGNAINPLVSLADKDVFEIPLLLLIGWRGQEGVSDEPQHKKQGKITLPLLETLGIEYIVLPKTDCDAEVAVKIACEKMKKSSAPFALVVANKTFASYEKKLDIKMRNSLTREEALCIVINELPEQAIIISTTGKLSRELFELREAKKQGHERDFLTVGGMGHASQIALGIALAKPDRDIYCLDGDGAAIMHLGGWGVIGQTAPLNFRHIVFNNNSHDSVGGQPTGASSIDFLSIAKACGYRQAFQVKTGSEIKMGIEQLQKHNGPTLLEIRIQVGARKGLGRPTQTPTENKIGFMKFLHANK